MSTYGTGTYGSGTYGEPAEELAPAAPARIAVAREYPPDELAWRIDPPNGAPSRWAADEPNAENVATGMRLTDEMPGGDKEGSVVLARNPREPFPDLAPFSEIAVYGPGVDGVASYRLDKTPESDGERIAITVEAVGWSRALEDDNAVVGPGFITKDHGQWSGPSLERRKLLKEANAPHAGDPSSVWSTGTAALRLSVQGAWEAPGIPRVEAWFDAGGVRIGRVVGNWSGWPDTGWVLERVAASSDTGGLEGTGDVYTTVTGTIDFSPANPSRYFLFSWTYNATPGGSDAVEFPLDLTNLAVIGDHGLVLQGSWPNIGFTVSQMLGHAIPLHTTLEARPEDLEDTGYIVEQAWFSDPGPMSQVVQELTKYELLDWFVFGGKRFKLKRPGTYGRRWQAYAGPSGLQEQGLDASRLWREILVTYQDVDGSTRSVGPPGSRATVEVPGLAITDPDHPAVRADIPRKDRLDLRGISTPARAIEAGEIWLREANRLNRSGSATLSGYAMDDRGIMRPVSQIRAGDEVRFPDAADTSYRRIVRRSYEHDTRTCTVDLDAPPEGLQALLERLQADVQSLALS